VEDFLLAFLEPLFEPLAEFLLQLVVEFFLSFLWRKARVARWKARRISLLLMLPFLGVVGAFVGWISLLIIPTPIFQPGRVHGLSLFISPVLTGLMMALIGLNLTRRREIPAPLQSFSGGCSFAFGMALIRFLNAH
jgi:hypothetical protein